jgi:dTDP-4-amino-4,6-dideoxygalactose transaminase
MSYYRDRYRLDPADFPEAERPWAGCVALPIHPALTDEDVGYVCAALVDLLG